MISCQLIVELLLICQILLVMLIPCFDLGQSFDPVLLCLYLLVDLIKLKDLICQLLVQDVYVLILKFSLIDHLLQFLLELCFLLLESAYVLSDLLLGILGSLVH